MTSAVAPVRASPLARKLAKDTQIDLAGVQGTGPGGRIVQRDVEKVRASGPTGSAGVRRRSLQPEAGAAREDQVIPLTKLRQAIARRMTESKVTVPHFYVTHEYAVEALLAARRQLVDFVGEDEKPSINDFIVRAAALSLLEFPNLNASFAGENTIQHGSVNIGVAVAVENGLLTVVCKNADQKPLLQIAAEVKAMVVRARAGKVKPDDIEGSTFSVSNLGMYDVEDFSAILNPPEAAILAVSSAREVAVAESGQVHAGWRMKATLSVDHRVSNGAEAARFMQKLGEYLDNPARLLV
jgi:pyruvate dehydrogenase E2 component (dihydrolipoamide acetyltransferase)